MQSRPTIFYVDDNQSSQRLLALILKDAGFTVITESSPLHAAKRVTDLSFDLALVDYQMPGMTGAQLAQEMRKVHPDIPIIMISGFENLPASELSCVDAFYGRSTSLTELLETVSILTGSPMRPTGVQHTQARTLTS